MPAAETKAGAEQVGDVREPVARSPAAPGKSLVDLSARLKGTSGKRSTRVYAVY